MRILELRQSLRYGNLERLIVGAASHLRRSGIETAILVLYNRTRARLLGEDTATLPETHPLLADATRYGIEAYQVYDDSVLSLEPLRAILRTLKDRRYDIIHTHDFKTDVLGLLAGRLTDVPVVATAHGYPRAIRRNEVYRYLDLVALRFCAHVICVSHSIRKELETSGLPANKLTVVHNGIAVDDVRARVSNGRQTLRQDVHLRPDDVILMAVGRLSWEKGHCYLLQAMADGLAADPRLQLVIVGDGPLRSALQRQAARSRVGDRVHFLGFRSDVASLMAQCDILVTPSVGEALGNVILEAMALAKPVVGTTAGGMPEVIRHGETGLIVPVADSRALSDAIRQLAGDLGRAQRMGRLGQARAMSEFTVEAMADGLAKAFAQCSRKP